MVDSSKFVQTARNRAKTRGHSFYSAPVAQQIEQPRPKGLVGGAIPSRGTQEKGEQVNPYQDRLEEPMLTLPPVNPHLQEKEDHHVHKMTAGQKINFVIMRTIGNFLLFLSIYGVGATFGPALYYEGQYRVAQARGIEYSVVSQPVASSSSEIIPTPTPVAPGFGSVIAGEQQQVLVPPDTTFSLVIPKIGATAKIYPNVDPTDENDFLTKLQTGIAHAKGTVFPGFEGNTYLFAHSTDNFWNVGRYNAVFYLLKELKPGDEIIVFFENKRFNYKVERTEIRDAEDVELLVDSQIPGKEQLIMQTCWPPGTTWKRLFVIATPK